MVDQNDKYYGLALAATSLAGEPELRQHSQAQLTSVQPIGRASVFDLVALGLSRHGTGLFPTGSVDFLAEVGHERYR